MIEGFDKIALDDAHAIWRGRWSGANDDAFDALWAHRPENYHRILMGGRWVDTPRWQQAYGVDYRYTGHINRAKPVPLELEPFLRYARSAIEPRLNGILVNWYAGEHGHYIGRHRDKPHDLIAGAPIVTISLGADRTFRLRPHKGKGKIDLRIDAGTVIVLPHETNLTWTHEVPRFATDHGDRISVTVRAFKREAVDDHRPPRQPAAH